MEEALQRWAEISALAAQAGGAVQRDHFHRIRLPVRRRGAGGAGGGAGAAGGGAGTGARDRPRGYDRRGIAGRCADGVCRGGLRRAGLWPYARIFITRAIPASPMLWRRWKSVCAPSTAALAGLAGCPFAPAATGNIPTEDTTYMLHRMGYDTGLHLPSLVQGVLWLESRIGRVPGMLSKAGAVPAGAACVYRLCLRPETRASVGSARAVSPCRPALEIPKSQLALRVAIARASHNPAARYPCARTSCLKPIEPGGGAKWRSYCGS